MSNLCIVTNGTTIICEFCKCFRWMVNWVVFLFWSPIIKKRNCKQRSTVMLGFLKNKLSFTMLLLHLRKWRLSKYSQTSRDFRLQYFALRASFFPAWQDHWPSFAHVQRVSRFKIRMGHCVWHAADYELLNKLQCPLFRRLKVKFQTDCQIIKHSENFTIH